MLLAGCSLTGSAPPTSPPKTLTKGRFTYLVRHDTRRDLCPVAHLEKPRTYGQVRANLKKLLTAYEHWLFAMHGLVPPARVAAAFKGLLGAMNRLDLNLNSLVDAVDARDAPRIKRLVEQGKHLIARFDTRFHLSHGHSSFTCAGKGAASWTGSVTREQPPAAPPAKRPGHTCTPKHHIRFTQDGRVFCVRRPVFPVR